MIHTNTSYTSCCEC